ncbi:P-loop containing nucleoside triphosphate hydrolase [Arabidopsis thaliana x Arabidopsis arenosa]|uniref:P-loop containing nucleoside triphosphate hydrolase n=1 Tax=Arabidopsis thaliana x Arabidopsis arenosa TaxID=1240361 RepID=A0A8T1XV37_9BRAS|nr:P-loop containing nucleoside triphosphate hydrolase [Arabidopsis thaliana x Arabidopsis arenosa]
MESTECVRVAVNIRPLITPELLNGCTDCITVAPKEPQVHIGSHTFTYDFVYGNAGYPCSEIYNHCVAPLVDALFKGYNATVLAYGQTGSGKTYTMGTNYSGDGTNGGIIPNVMEDIFRRVESTKDSSELLIRVSFIEIFKEEVFDLLDSNSSALLKNDSCVQAKHTALSRAPIQIRETASGGITLAGVTEAEVKTKEEMGSYLARGSLCRATGSTNMNSQSSRSHAIFTITLEQKKIASGSFTTTEDGGEDILCAKLHLVDLAGSERAKRTGADGMRLKEGIHINKGLLALGNVISALGDEKKRKEGGHVPYRDSKLTRLLQDSLGGNSKTVMIACVSPADTNAEETLNTLKYANRARNIQNKAVINRDPATAQMQRMRSQIEQLQTELLFYRGDSGAFDELQILKHKISLLEASNRELQNELQERRVASEHFSKRAYDAQVEKDKLIMIIESVRNGKTLDEIESCQNEDVGLVKKYVSKIQELEGELLHIKSLKKSSNHQYSDDTYDDGPRSNNVLFPSSNESSDCEDKVIDVTDELEFQEKEIEHSSLQEKLDMELKELDKRLEEKEAEMKRFSSGGTSVLKQHYEKKVHDLEQEKRALQREIEGLRQNLASIPSGPGDGAQKLKEEYVQKLNTLETQVSILKKKQDAQAQLMRQKQKSDDAAIKLQDEIHRIKSQKVQLQQKIKQESEQFRAWKASREKEVMQLKKEGRRNEYEMHKLMALNQKQKLVLQRKTEEASQVTKRLKEVLDSRKASSRETLSGASVNGPGTQALMQAIEHEIEVTVRVHEVRSEYERQKEERARMAKEVARLREENELLKNAKISVHGDTMSPGARNSRIFALENMLATSSNTLVSMASQLSEAEERERVFGGRGRWNQVRTLGDAKSIMNYLFNLASTARCLARDKEADCREKDVLIRDLKEKIVKFSSYVRYMEIQKADLVHQVKAQTSAMKKLSAEENLKNEHSMKKQETRNSTIVLEDMDTSDSEESGHEREDPDIDDEWKPEHESERESEQESVIKLNRKRNFKVGRRRSSVVMRRSYEENSEAPSDDAVKSDVCCCTCSKSSSCKTMKCQCRATKGSCGPSCGCSSVKCSNRNADGKENNSISESEALENGENSQESDEKDKDQQQQVLASRGAMLLQNALADKPGEETNDDGGTRRRRKPLSDIGNTTGKSNVPRPSQRKKWKKTVLQLVPVGPPALPTPPASSQEEANPVTLDSEAARMPENSESGESNSIKLKLPRAMRSASSNGSNLLRERNADQNGGESVGNGGFVPSNSGRASGSRTSDEKENHTRRI